jgi:hypothetical protein
MVAATMASSMGVILFLIGHILNMGYALDISNPTPQLCPAVAIFIGVLVLPEYIVFREKLIR